VGTGREDAFMGTTNRPPRLRVAAKVGVKVWATLTLVQGQNAWLLLYCMQRKANASQGLLLSLIKQPLNNPL